MLHGRCRQRAGPSAEPKNETRDRLASERERDQRESDQWPVRVRGTSDPERKESQPEKGIGRRTEHDDDCADRRDRVARRDPSAAGDMETKKWFDGTIQAVRRRAWFVSRARF